jgi:lysyl-tRNA synthetase class 2
MRKIIVNKQIFELFPGFYRGLVIVEDIDNSTPSEHVAALLKQAIEQNNAIDVAQDPRLKGWDEAHKKFGSNPNKFPPSIKALLKRIKSNATLPYINSVVAMFNYISLKYCLPCGGDDVEKIAGDLILGFSDGSETFLALGADNMETPVPGEVIYYDSGSKKVMCRRWNWRNGAQTKIDTSTRKIVINIDCIAPSTQEVGVRARDELASCLKDYCGAKLKVDGLHVERRELVIDF